jgi:hypothetical protein
MILKDGFKNQNLFLNYLKTVLEHQWVKAQVEQLLPE